MKNSHNEKNLIGDPADPAKSHSCFGDDHKEKKDIEKDKLRRRLIWEQKNRKEIHK